MKEKMMTIQCAEVRKNWVWKALTSVALAWVLSLWSPSEWLAQNISAVQEGANVTEVTKLWAEAEQEKDRVTLEEAAENTEEDWTYVIEEYRPEIEPNSIQQLEWEDKTLETKKPRIETHGFIQVWTSVVPDFASIFSDKASMLMCVDATETHSWLWISLIRLDDFSSDPAYPISRASVIVPHRSKSLWEGGKWIVWASVECTFIDKMPGNIEIMPVVFWSYSTDSGWSFEWKYFHIFQKWEDMKSFRLWISKKISDALKLTAQWWYKSDYDKHFFGRIIVDVDLWHWLWAQLSCIAKDWKITPTAWVVYQF